MGQVPTVATRPRTVYALDLQLRVPVLVFVLIASGASLPAQSEEAGGSAIAVVKTFHGLQPDENGRPRLTFASLRNNAALNYLEIDDESK